VRLGGRIGDAWDEAPSRCEQDPIAVDAVRRLLLASTGGHLTELVLLADRLVPAATEEVWVTFDSPQSRQLLAGCRVEYIADTPPRDFRKVVLNVRAASQLLAKYRPDQLVTNGAGIALSFAPLAAARGISTHYIECSARTEAPSLTGRLLENVPGLRLYAQDPQFAVGRWRFEGSVFDRYAHGPGTGTGEVKKVVVTVGSLHFSFKRLVDRLRGILPSEAEVLLQLGVDSANTEWDRGEVHASIAPDVLDREMKSADVVIAHSGIGSALAALNAGRMPILVPRSKRHREHVDDHQAQIAGALDVRGLARHADASELSFADLVHVAGRSIVTRPPRPFVLR
jgi:UDP-N-acetylglucosamine--N-acetylmuramyl-(pentapeptide) pyrophosphoryl-undecaprenol N-acetylglucosamine transferase